MEISAGVQLQAMQLDYARQAIAQAQADQPSAITGAQPQAMTKATSDVVLDLSFAAQQLLGG